MMQLIWRIRYTFRICTQLRDPMFWRLWWISGEAVKDEDWVERIPREAADEELSYWSE